MIADGDTVNVRMSADYGATWSNVAQPGNGCHRHRLCRRHVAGNVKQQRRSWALPASTAPASSNFTIGSSASLFQASSAQARTAVRCSMWRLAG